MAVLFGTAIFFVAGLIYLAVIKFLELDLESRCFAIFMAVVILSISFQICNKIISDSKTREVEQHKIDN